MATGPAEETIRPAVGVPPERAEAVRRDLARAGLLDRTVQPGRDAEYVWFPLVPDADPAAIETAAGSGTGVVRERAFLRRARSIGHYSELLKDLPEDLRDRLPTSHDVIGHVVVLKLPDALRGHQDRIATALLEAHPQVQTIALDHGVTGSLRVRDLEVIAGDPDLTTLHREHGLTLEIALDRVYFSPRLATERARLVERIAPGARVLDLFAGVGAFVCLVARDRAPTAVYAIDLNPDAARLLRRNLERNRIQAPVTVQEGDARAVAPRTHDWDHVVMNLPHDAAAFLDVAADCVAPDGEIHLYAMVERAEHDAVVARIEADLTERMGAPWRVVAERHVRNYAPTMDGLSFTLRAAR